MVTSFSQLLASSPYEPWQLKFSWKRWASAMVIRCKGVEHGVFYHKEAAAGRFRELSCSHGLRNSGAGLGRVFICDPCLAVLHIHVETLV